MMGRGWRKGAGPRYNGNMDSDLPDRIRKAVKAGRTPLDLWMEVIEDKDAPLALRLACARDAAPYIHPKLSHAVVEDRSADRLTEFLTVMREERQRISGPSKNNHAIDLTADDVMVMGPVTIAADDGSI